ncbi:hypothetical protein [Paracoccus nototheniae]|uniref:hypothetical protein n=1 Tax=Paracoccus nototheniae TaxID=2489002 RepID=UPI001A95514A|nr:hypothetical protein [Paracoccus nototheniae]
MDLKDVLGEIEPGDGNIFHRHPASVAILTTSPCHIAMPSGGGVHTIKMDRCVLEHRRAADAATNTRMACRWPSISALSLSAVLSPR